MANTKNNKRRQESQRRIRQALVELLDEQDLNHVTIAAICERAGVNRSTFYANYRDVYDLAEQLGAWSQEQMAEIIRQESTLGYDPDDYLRIFRHVREHQDAYNLYFKLGLDASIVVTEWDAAAAERHFGGKHIDYHIEFFRTGLTAVIRKWLAGGCQESPEEMAEVIRSEYQGRWD